MGNDPGFLSLTRSIIQTSHLADTHSHTSVSICLPCIVFSFRILFLVLSLLYVCLLVLFTHGYLLSPLLPYTGRFYPHECSDPLPRHVFPFPRSSTVHKLTCVLPLLYFVSGPSFLYYRIVYVRDGRVVLVARPDTDAKGGPDWIVPLSCK